MRAVDLALPLTCLVTVVSCHDSHDQAPSSQPSGFIAGDDDSLRRAEELSFRHIFEVAPSLIAGVDAVWTTRVAIDRLGEAHTRLVQTVDNIPVFGGEAIVHLHRDGSFKLFSDDLIRDIDVDTTPLLTELQAMDLAVAETGGWDRVTGVPAVDLQILRHDGGDHLTYRVQLIQLEPGVMPAAPVVFIDAHTGAVTWRYNDLQTAALSDEDKHTYDMNNGEVSNAVIDFSNAIIADSSDTIANDAHVHTGLVLDYLATAHGRDSFDDAGTVVYSYVHVNTNWVNAARIGNFVFYGDGDGVLSDPLVTLDVVAHEIAHAVTGNSAGLIYYGESGALNEATSDIFAAAVEAAQPGATSDDIWWIAEDCWLYDDALRYMDDPARGYGVDYYPTRSTGTNDNGGVHSNSGIANLFFHLLVEGGTHPSGTNAIAVTGIGMTDAMDIWYRALTVYMTASTTFLDARDHTVQAARDLFGATSTQVAQVNNAWDAVGVRRPRSRRVIDVRDHLSGGQRVFGPYNASYYSALRFSLSNGSDSAVLYVRRGSPPVYDASTFSVHADCIETGIYSTDEVCEFYPVQPGDYYVMVHGLLRSYSGVTLTVTGEGVADATTVAVKTRHNKYVVAEEAGGDDVNADRTSIGRWETLDLIELDTGSFVLQAPSGHLICPDSGGGGDVHATGMAVSDDCYLTAVEQPGGKLAFETSTGHYLCAQLDGQFVADRTSIGTWEQFEIVPVTSTKTEFGLRSSDDKYVVADAGGGGDVDANRNNLGGWETFKLIESGNGSALLRTRTGHYVCPDNGGGDDVHSTELTADCYLTAIDRPDGKLALRTRTGHYLSARSSGELLANRTSIGSREEFAIVPVPTLAKGNGWASGDYATSVAFGDVDGDGRDEIGVTRRTDSGVRYWILDDATLGFAVLHEGGTSWGSNNYATSIAFGDVDGDGRDEVGVTRVASGNSRYFILDDAEQGFATLKDGGSSWNSDNYATAIAFGDVDGDGFDEVGVARKASSNRRYFILDDAHQGFSSLKDGGVSWGSDNYATAIAFGDVDGDGRDEVGVTRRASNNGRYWVLDDAGQGFSTLKEGGTGWGSDNYATSIAFGDVDGDGRDEVGVTRRASNNGRYWVRDDAVQGFAELKEGGANWGSDSYATAIAFGDIDGDGRDEVGVTRDADTNSRYWILDDDAANFTELRLVGDDWGSSDYGTGIAFGNMDDDPEAEFGLTRRASSEWRYSAYDYYTH